LTLKLIEDLGRSSVVANYIMLNSGQWLTPTTLIYSAKNRFGWNNSEWL